jgi:hypothetical protein
MTRSVVLVSALAIASCAGQPSGPPPRPPIIDMHLHAYPAAFWGSVAPPNPVTGTPSPAQTDDAILRASIAALERYNIVKAVVSGPLELAQKYRLAAPERVLVSPHFPGLLPFPDLGRLRVGYGTGELGAMAEVLAQYEGMAPGDPALAPYFALAAELDIPVGIHMGPTEPGVTYGLAPKYRAAMGNPLLLEDLLNRHPKLRVYMMHAGWPFIDETLAMLDLYPQLYVEVGVIDWIYPRPQFHAYLRRLFEAGFGGRVMFGSDQMVWPEAIGMAIEGIEAAEFLTDGQKRDVFYNNAATFLRLDSAEMVKHGAK